MVRAGRSISCTSETETDVITIRLLSFVARVRAPAAIRARLRQVFPISLRARTTPRRSASFLVDDTGREAQRYIVSRDGACLATCDQPDNLIATLEWAIVSAAVEQSRSSHLLIHAGAVACGGVACLLPGSSGSGKTTLTVGLLAAGFAYLSDEIAAISLATGRLEPFAKSLTIKAGSRRLLAAQFHELQSDSAGLRAEGEQVWYLRPPSNAWPSVPLPVRYIVFPRYIPGSPTSLTAISRSEALPRLLAQAFIGPAGDGESVACAVELLQHTDCYALTTGDLAASVSLMQSLLGGERADSTVPQRAANGG